MKTFRASQIYISTATRRNLRVIARSEGPERTADEVGERLLSETITERYPVLTSLQKQIEEIEGKMLTSLKPVS